MYSTKDTLDFGNQSVKLKDIGHFDIFEFHVGIFEGNAQRSNFVFVCRKSFVFGLWEKERIKMNF